MTIIVNFGDIDVGMFAPLESLQIMNQFCTLPKDMDIQQLKPRNSVNQRAHASRILREKTTKTTSFAVPLIGLVIAWLAALDITVALQETKLRKFD